MYGSSTQEISSITGRRHDASKDLIRGPRNERGCTAHITFDSVIDLRFVDCGDPYNPLNPREIIRVIGKLRGA
jgi:hypothetical protein